MFSNHLAAARQQKCPKLSFHNNTEKKVLSDHLSAYLQWIDQANISPSKKILMGNIVGYISNVNSHRLLGITTDTSRYFICSNILALGDLPDILFTQYVINELSKIQDVKSTLRDCNLPLAKSYMKLLLIPYTKEMKNIGLGLVALGVVLATTDSLPKLSIFIALLGAVAAFSSQPFAEYRIQTALTDRLNAIEARALNMNIEVAAPLEDELEPAVSALAEIAAMGTRILRGFFSQERARLERIAEGMEPPRYGDSQRRLN